MFGLTKKKTNKDETGNWGYTRLRIKKSHLSIGCGGEHDAALPFIGNFVNEINEIALNSEYLETPCYIESDGGYINIMNLTGFTTQAGWMLIGMLLKQGWFIKSCGFEEFPHQVTPRDPIKDPIINMMKKNNMI